MKKQTKYSPDFKLQVVKEYSDLSLSDIASKFGIPSANTIDGLNCTLILI